MLYSVLSGIDAAVSAVLTRLEHLSFIVLNEGALISHTGTTRTKHLIIRQALLRPLLLTLLY